MNEREKKVYDLGLEAKALINLHKDCPTAFKAEVILNRLSEVYENHGFDKKNKKAAISGKITA